MHVGTWAFLNFETNKKAQMKNGLLLNPKLFNPNLSVFKGKSKLLSYIKIPFFDELNTGSGKTVYLEIISNGEYVLNCAGTQAHCIEIHVVDDLAHNPAVRDVLQLHTRRVFFTKFAKH